MDNQLSVWLWFDIIEAMEKRFRRKRVEKESPCPELDAWLAEGELRRQQKIVEGRLGIQRRLRGVLQEQYGRVAVPIEVTRRAEGLMSGLGLQMWWVTPNPWLWPKNKEGFDITSEYLNAAGETIVTPMMMWMMGQGEDVIDLLRALRGDLDEPVTKAVVGKKQRGR